MTRAERGCVVGTSPCFWPPQAHRNITTIKDISYVPDDVRAFRITFDDDGELVSVEYQAENPRMCGT